MADEYRRFWISSSGPVERECLLAEAFDAGAEGAEEIEVDGRFRACIYATSNRIEQIRDRVSASASEATEIGVLEPLPQVDWSEAWKQGLEAFEISKRLLIRPPSVAAELESGQREIIIEPGQAFGTGGHASTRLCLEWIDELLVPGGIVEPSIRVVDVGTGSGVLALAAAALGAGFAVGFDLDPVAAQAARQAAIRNPFDANTHFFTGPIEALREPGGSDPGYGLVLANLLKREMLPIASQIAHLVDRSGRLILAGLLEEDVAEVESRFADEDLIEVGRRSSKDSTGEWVGLCLAFA